jgi:TonB family protein
MGHVILISLVFFLPTSKKKVFIENIPRSVQLVASLDVPAPPVPAPKPRTKPRPVPKPAPRPRPRVVKPAPPPPPVKSRVQIPTKEAPPLVKPREPLPAPTSMRERLQSKLARVDTPPPAVPEPNIPAVAAPKVAPLTPLAPSSPVQAAPAERASALSGFRYRGYVGSVKSSLYARWNPPSSFTLGGRNLTAVTMIRISRDGRISRIDMKRTSGHRIFDQSVMAALTDSSALPPFPKDYKENYLDVEITFRPEDR